MALIRPPLPRLEIRFLVLLFVLVCLSWEAGRFSSYWEKLRIPASTPHSHNLHVLIPGNAANSRICRTLATAIINDYPSIKIINWGLKGGDAEMNGYDMTTGKNWGVLKYLRSLPPEKDKDLVIMVDAHDVVFQLPVDITLQRYKSANRNAISRLKGQHDDHDIAKYGLSQTILMGAEKFCWPLDHRHPACYAVPESLIKANAYGENTDQSLETNRPRWLNSGTIIGPVDDLRELYEWAHLLWKGYPAWGGDQDYFSNIYGTQELSRQRLRGTKNWVFGFGEKLEEKDLIIPNVETEHTDYHLGVDLNSSIFQTLNKALDDMSSVVHSNRTDLSSKDHLHGTASIYQEHFPFPQDLLKQRPPFQGLQDDMESTDRSEQLKKTWRDVRLHSNFHARSIPSIMHYNGDKSHMDDWWHRQWWTGWGRELMEVKMSRPGFQISTDSKSNPKLLWTDICSEFDDEVFVDQVESYL